MIDATAALTRLVDGGDLTREETEELVGRLMEGELSEVEKAGLLMGLAVKGESPQEIAGAAAAMRRRVVRIPHDCERVLDTCGTGGDRSGTFNISTASALVAAAGGATVAKHGNRSVSSRSGSADVLAALGVPLEVEPDIAARALEDIGIAFLFAPRLHPAMREVMPVRTGLGVRTVFNVLGPLTNPAGATRQLLGVYSRDLVPVIGEVLVELGSEHALVVHGEGGLDEMSTVGTTWCTEVRDGQMDSWTVEPEDVGLTRVSAAALAGADPRDNARAMRDVLGGSGRGPLAEIVALNAGAALYVAGMSDGLAEGVERAREVLADGAALAKLEELAGFSV